VLLSPLRGRQSDLDITERAVRQSWPLCLEKRAEIIQECARLALESASERVRVQAMRVLVQMDALNVRRERNEQEVEEAKAAMTAARQAWTQALENAQDPGETEKVHQEAKARADLLQERLDTLRKAADRWKKVTDDLWDKYRDEYIRQRKQLAEDRFVDAEAYIAKNDPCLHARRIAYDEFQIVKRLSLGLAGLRGICPLV
jgi:hypothetical protein